VSTYREIIGKKIKKVSSDPSSGLDGEMWYNSTTGTLRGPAILEAWTSASPLITARYETRGAGTTTAALCIGGYTTTTLANTEEFNGSGWATGGAMPGVKSASATGGTQTAAFVTGGYPGPGGNTNTYEYNGTAWTAANALGTARRNFVGAGTQTAGLALGGMYDPPDTPLTATEEYDGTNWTSGNAMGTAASNSGSAGIQTAALNIAGFNKPSNTAVTEEYDGTNWATGGSVNTTRQSLGGSGTQGAALAVGGGTPSASTATETYDGSSWTTSPASLATARLQQGAAQSAPGSTGLAFGGLAPSPYLSATEEYNKSTTAVTAAAWSSGTNMGSARYGGQYFGTGKTSQVAVSGHVPGSPPITATSETYDGTTWTEGNNINTARYNGGSGGVETAGLVVCGRDPSSAPAPQVYYSNVEEYNGTSYSEQTDCPEAAYGKAGAGTQTAWVGVGGFLGPAPSPSYSTASQEYDGTNWTAGGAAPFQAVSMSGVGITTAAVIFGQQQNPAANDKVYDYNGTSWTAANDMNRNHGGQHSACGTVTSALVAGGSGPYADSAVSELYDGTTWSTSATLGQSGLRGGKGTSSPAAIGAGGYGPGFFNATEEFTAETEATNIETFTTS